MFRRVLGCLIAQMLSIIPMSAESQVTPSLQSSSASSNTSASVIDLRAARKKVVPFFEVISVADVELEKALGEKLLSGTKSDYFIDYLELNLRAPRFCNASGVIKSSTGIWYWIFHYGRKELGNGGDMCVLIDALSGKVTGRTFGE